MHRPLAALALLSAITIPVTALAYKVREAAPGSPVRWGVDHLTVVVDPSVDEIGEGARTAIGAAFAEWAGVPDAFTPAVTIESGPADAIGYRQRGENRCTVRFVGEGAEIAGKALAVTVVTYDAQGGILDADVVVNGGNGRHFGIVDLEGPESRYDLQAVVTHEVGHFLGLGDEGDIDEATMFSVTARAETKKRDLSADDESGLQSLYMDPADGTVTDGVASCAAGRPGRGTRSSWCAAIAVGLGAWLVTRRRAAGRRRGAAAGALSLALFAAVPTGQSSVSPPRHLARVSSVQSRWDGGIVVSRVAVEVTSCEGAGAGCAAGTHEVEVLGGTIAGLRQVVGHEDAPSAGDLVTTLWDNGRLSLVAGRGTSQATP
jgi:hypothetical protein